MAGRGAPGEGASTALVAVKQELDSEGKPIRTEPANGERRGATAERQARTASGKAKAKARGKPAVKREETGSGKASKPTRVMVMRRPASRVKKESLEEHQASRAKRDTPAAKRSRESSAIRASKVKREPEESPSVEQRIPFYIAQCRAFHLAQRIWRPKRPCCMANCLTKPLRMPKEGMSCYDRMTKEQKKRFEQLVADPQAAVKERPSAVSVRLFKKLLHPERQPDITMRRVRVEDEPEISMTQVPFQVPQDWAIGGMSPSLAKSLAMAKARQEKVRAMGGHTNSGVPGVRWDEKRRAWIASWKRGQGSTHRDRNWKSFPVQPHLDAGKTEEEAKEDALQEATIFRERLVCQGIVKVAKVGFNKGIIWNKARKGWDIFIRAYGKKMRGGFFKPVDQTPEAMEKARLAAIEFREQLELTYGRHGSTIQRQVMLQEALASAAPDADEQAEAEAHVAVVHDDDLQPPTGENGGAEAPSGADAHGEADARDEEDAQSEASVTEVNSKGGPVGVTWHRQGHDWNVQMWVNGKLDRRLFKPAEDKPEDLERELLAVFRQDTD